MHAESVVSLGTAASVIQRKMVTIFKNAVCNIMPRLEEHVPLDSGDVNRR